MPRPGSSGVTLQGATLGWAAGAALSFFCLVQGLRIGSAGSAMTRVRSPIGFWASMSFFALASAGSIYGAIAGI